MNKTNPTPAPPETLEPPERIRVVVRAATGDDWIGVAYCKDYIGDPSTIHEYRRATVAGPRGDVRCLICDSSERHLHAYADHPFVCALDLEVAKSEFLSASIAVWREIDRLSALPDGYKGLPQHADPRKRELAAWETYRGLLDTLANHKAAATSSPAPAESESPILAFDKWLMRYVADCGKLSQKEYGIAYAAFIAAHPGEGPLARTMNDPAPPERTPVAGEQSASEIYYEGLDRIWRLLDLKMERQPSDVATLQRIAHDYMVRGNALRSTEESIIDHARKLAVEISGDTDSADEIKTFQQAWQIIEGVVTDKAGRIAK